MKYGVIGKKSEMTQIFDEKGNVIPVTLINLKGSVVVGKSSDKVIVGYGKKRKANKADLGRYKDLGYVPQIIKEFALAEDTEVATGAKVEMDFEVGDVVNVTGVSKGKGFQGVVKRWGFAGGPKTHGQSDRHRAPGSIGGGTTPGRVYKGKKLPGRMGGKVKTVEGLKIAYIDKEQMIIGVKGAVPGNKNGILYINNSKK